MKSCDIIIPVWNQPDITKNCLEAIKDNTGYPYKLILIDNGSDNETRLYLDGLARNHHPEVRVIRNEQNLGFVKAVNQGLRTSSTPYICIMNNDTLPAPGWLEGLVEFAELNKDMVQNMGRFFGVAVGLAIR